MSSSAFVYNLHYHGSFEGVYPVHRMLFNLPNGVYDCFYSAAQADVVWILRSTDKGKTFKEAAAFQMVIQAGPPATSISLSTTSPFLTWSQTTLLSGQQAFITLSGAFNVRVGDTVTVDGVTYTFVDKNSPMPFTAPNQVGIGLDGSLSLINLMAAISGTAGDYSSGTQQVAGVNGVPPILNAKFGGRKAFAMCESGGVLYFLLESAEFSSGTAVIRFDTSTNSYLPDIAGPLWGGGTVFVSPGWAFGGDISNRFCMAVDAAGVIHVAYNSHAMEAVGGFGWDRSYYTAYGGGSWSADVLIAGGGDQHHWRCDSITVGKQNRLHFIMNVITGDTSVAGSAYASVQGDIPASMYHVVLSLPSSFSAPVLVSDHVRTLSFADFSTRPPVTFGMSGNSRNGPFSCLPVLYEDQQLGAALAVPFLFAAAATTPWAGLTNKVAITPENTSNWQVEPVNSTMPAGGYQALGNPMCPFLWSGSLWLAWCTPTGDDPDSEDFWSGDIAVSRRSSTGAWSSPQVLTRMSQPISPNGITVLALDNRNAVGAISAVNEPLFIAPDDSSGELKTLAGEQYILLAQLAGAAPHYTRPISED